MQSCIRSYFYRLVLYRDVLPGKERLSKAEKYELKIERWTGCARSFKAHALFTFSKVTAAKACKCLPFPGT